MLMEKVIIFASEFLNIFFMLNISVETGAGDGATGPRP
jgi:hypothetical protein